MVELHDVCYAALRKLPFPDFCAILCVMLEHKCKEEGIDVKEAAEQICKTIISVNEELGQV